MKTANAIKLLVVTDNDAIPAEHPFVVTETHINEIRRASIPKVSVAVVHSTQAAEQHSADANIVLGFPATIPDCQKLLRTQWIHSLSSGLEALLTPELMRSSILVSNSAGVHATPVAEHVLGFMLMFTRRFHQAFHKQARRVWERDLSLGELRGKNVLIVGAGHIGMEVGRLASCFGARISAITRTIKDRPMFVEHMGRTEDLDSLLPMADFVVLALPYTQTTHHLIDTARLRLMKPTSVIINVGRGGLINQEDLMFALQEQRIHGAALDVSTVEPLPSDHQLWDMENVIITSHHASLSDQYMNRAIALFCKNLQAFLRGEPLPTLVNKALGY